MTIISWNLLFKVTVLNLSQQTLNKMTLTLAIVSRQARPRLLSLPFNRPKLGQIHSLDIAKAAMKCSGCILECSKQTYLHKHIEQLLYSSLAILNKFLLACCACVQFVCVLLGAKSKMEKRLHVTWLLLYYYRHIVYTLLQNKT